ncbi:nucleotidyltransferase [Mycoplasma crocodyli]|uniref:Flavokinase-like nucleotidyl transferase n=1 Tax=Mycoplasma crocodyli (strain ATCC 51981 / MP145) TaxID=512564 RepID=D5E569_MYCCM|nr:nucleotidyltransferase [Mycoplasma crocodyli]ADE19747.1 flavokinase-like nucleotidyl transferase [Mycoplasma crocodyli MP145]
MTNKRPKVGIIAEYNPFHNGHLFQLNWIKERFNNPYIIVAMSYKYSQRGERCIYSWSQRKKVAKKFGVNKFIKLGVNISAQAAHIFARESILKLNKEKIDYLVFGSETNDINLFKNIAITLKEKESEYNNLIKKYLKVGGNSFPRSTNLALQELTNSNISMPNDILGIEYVKTIVNNNLNIEPICIKRTIDFHSQDLENNFASATKLREMIKNNIDVSNYTPVDYGKYKKQKDIRCYYKKFQKIIRNTSPEKLRKYKMISEGIENLFKKNIEEKTYDIFVEKCTSKRYTSSRIKRTILFVLLKHKK